MTIQHCIQATLGLWVAIASASVVHHPFFPPAAVRSPAIATTAPTAAPARLELPRSMANTVRRTFRRDYQNRIANIRIVHAEPATWEDCDPDLPRGRFSYHPCEATSRTGWRVIVMGEFPTIHQTMMKTYYVDQRSWAVASHVEEVSEDMRSHIASRVRVPPSELQILAAQEESLLPATACPDEGLCPTPPLYLGWRILTVANGLERIVRLSGFGSPIDSDIHVEEQDMAALGDLPVALANAVLQDAQERFNTPEWRLEATSDAPVELGIQVESVEPVTWNDCSGGSGPSQPLRGICPNIQQSGWRMVVAGGSQPDPLRLVYYIPQGADLSSWIPQPDGLQSLSEATQRRILGQIAADAGMSSSNLRLFWVEARFFDRCLNASGTALSCGLDIRPGWVVQILVSQETPGTTIRQPLWVYHTNLTGTDVRLVGQGEWLPPPMAAPVMP